jgi:hypothetical protein
MVSRARSARDLREVIKSLSDGYDTTYEKILLTIQDQYSQSLDEIKRLLQWLVVGFGPISTTQLAEAVSIRPDDESLDFEGIIAKVDDIIAPLCQLVVTRRVGGTLLVYLLHKTFKDYLTSDKLARGPAKQFHLDIGTANANLADLCLQYLSFSDFDLELPLDPWGLVRTKDGVVLLGAPISPEEDDDLPFDFPFQDSKRYSLYAYAALHWSSHVQLIEQRGCSTGETCQLRLQKFWGKHNEKKRKLWTRTLKHNVPTGDEPISYAIFAHLGSFLDNLLSGPVDIHRHFEDGTTCLTTAALHNNIYAARKLLDLGANVNQATEDRKRRLTPLHLAAELGHEDMVDLLLSAGANVHIRSTSETTAFYRAARGGSIHILRRLHELGSEVDACSWDGWTALMEAIENEKLNAVIYLLELGADPQKENDEGRTPLSIAEWIYRCFFSVPKTSAHERWTVSGKILTAVRTAVLGAANRKESETPKPTTPSSSYTSDTSQSGANFGNIATTFNIADVLDILPVLGGTTNGLSIP